MTNYFFDSSALLKRYIPETGTGWVQSIIAPGSGNAVTIAHIAQAEIISAVMRRYREKYISLQVAQAARRVVDAHVRHEYTVIRLTNRIIRRAEDLLEIHALRAYDAVQLASVLEANHQLLASGSQPLIFLSADQRLISAAGIEGLMTDNPNVHP